MRLPSLPQRSSLAGFWGLDDSICFLNHGSYGASPTCVLEHQSMLRNRLEQEPVRFMMRELEPLLDNARAVLSRLVGADEEGVVFVPNATTAVNAILHSIKLNAGDELLTTNHVYNACANALNQTASRYNARVVTVSIPLPIQNEQQVIDCVMGAVNERTKLVLIDHITSPTAVVFPVKELVQRLRERGVETLVDGAHALGMVPLDLSQLGAAYYTANCHKWLCAPKGAAFLHVRKDLREKIRPVVISHGANSPRTERSRYWLEFDWTGTADPTAYLCVPRAIEFLEQTVPGGLSAVMQNNRDLALKARQLLLDGLGGESLCPESMIGSLAAVSLGPLPEYSSLVDPWQDELFYRWNIEVPIIPWRASSERLVRVSAHLHNAYEQYEYLLKALLELRHG